VLSTAFVLENAFDSVKHVSVNLFDGLNSFDEENSTVSENVAVRKNIGVLGKYPLPEKDKVFVNVRVPVNLPDSLRRADDENFPVPEKVIVFVSILVSLNLFVDGSSFNENLGVTVNRSEEVNGED
jgi:hypothetical protein